jgi:hypothetical protein
MKTRALPFNSLLLCGILIANVQQLWSAEDSHRATSPPAQKSDREKYNLRGPVKTVLTETTSPSRALPGRQVPERTGSYRVEFDSDGHLTEQESRGEQEYSVRYERDASGRLLKQIFTSPNQETTESLYSYDDEGRELSIVNSKTPNNPDWVFHYDVSGRKSMVLTSRPEDYNPDSRGAMDSPFSDAAHRGPNVPDGGTSTVLYDELDRPVEAQVRDSKGTLLTRALRKYDAQGNIIEDKDAMGPQPKAASQRESSDSADCDDETEKVFSVSHAYDEKGRLKLTVTRSSQQDEWTEFIYNDQGDTNSTITRTFEKGSESQSSYYEYHREYKYDTHGNWTESTSFFRHSPDGKFEPTDRSKRTITYF